MTTNAFHIESRLCYDTSCSEVELKWVRDFDGTNSDAYALIMLVFPVGARIPGIYVKDLEKKWQLVMPFEMASEIFSTSTHTLKVIFNNNQNTTYDSDTFIVFRSGKRLDVPAIEQSQYDVWAICEALPSAESVTKDSNAASEGLIQISAGPNKSIKDYIPPNAGVVTVGADGKIGVQEFIPLLSGGGLLLGQILKP